MFKAISRASAYTLVGTLALAASGAFWAAPARAASPVTLEFVSPTTGEYFLGNSTVVVRADLGDHESADLTVTFLDLNVSQVVAKADCPTTCDLSFPLDLASVFPGHWYSQGELTARWADGPDGDLISSYMVYAPPAVAPEQESITAAPSAVTAMYQGSPDTPTIIADGSITTTLSPTDNLAPPPGETVDIRLMGGDPSRTIASQSASWQATPSGPRAIFSFDTSAVPEGVYGLQSAERTTGGQYAPAGWYGQIVIRHTPPASASLDLPVVTPVMATRFTVTARGPLSAQPSAPLVWPHVLVDDSPVEVTLAACCGLSPFAGATLTDPFDTATDTFQIPTPTPGTHTLSIQPWAGTAPGHPVGPPIIQSLEVATLGLSATFGSAAVVGRPTTVMLAATSRPGEQLHDCWADLGTSAGLVQTNFCPTGGTVATAPYRWIPQQAGANAVTLHASSGTQLSDTTSVPATVYAARTASISAPTSTYGATAKVTVRLTDHPTLTSTQPTLAGVPVTLQLQKVGASAWLTLGAVKTLAGGVATFAPTSRYNGRYRVVYASTIPGVTETSGSVTEASAARVTWLRIPPSAPAFRTTYLTSSAVPYEVGAKATLQVRVHGTTAWHTVRTVSLPTTGTTSIAWYPGKRALWDVRVVRSTGRIWSTGSSSVRQVRTT